VDLRAFVDGAVRGLGDDHPAAADAEIDRFVQIAVLFLEHVAAGDAHVGGAPLDVGGHVGVAHDQHAQVVLRNRDHQPAPGARLLRRAQVDAGAREQRQRVLQDAAARQRQRQRLGGAVVRANSNPRHSRSRSLACATSFHDAPLARRTSAPSARNFLSRRS
jgi:hypothetical protein